MLFSSSWTSSPTEELHWLIVTTFLWCTPTLAVCFPVFWLGGRNINRKWCSPNAAPQFAGLAMKNPLPAFHKTPWHRQPIFLRNQLAAICGMQRQARRFSSSEVWLSVYHGSSELSAWTGNPSRQGRKEHCWFVQWSMALARDYRAQI